MQLPNEVREVMNQVEDSSWTLLPVRGLSSLCGELGETYLFLGEQNLYIVTRRVGQPFQRKTIPYREIILIEEKVDRPFLHLIIKMREHNEYLIKVSFLSHEDLSRGIQQLRKKINYLESGSEEELSVPGYQQHWEVEGNLQITPLTGFFAILYAIIRSDREVCERELHYLESIVEDPSIPIRGLALLQFYGYEEILKNLGELLTSKQKLCLLANVLDLVMVDGMLTKDERVILDQMQHYLNIPSEDVDRFCEVLTIKNQRKVFNI